MQHAARSGNESKSQVMEVQKNAKRFWKKIANFTNSKKHFRCQSGKKNLLSLRFWKFLYEKIFILKLNVFSLLDNFFCFSHCMRKFFALNRREILIKKSLETMPNWPHTPINNYLMTNKPVSAFFYFSFLQFEWLTKKESLSRIFKCFLYFFPFECSNRSFWQKSIFNQTLWSFLMSKSSIDY